MAVLPTILVFGWLATAGFLTVDCFTDCGRVGLVFSASLRLARGLLLTTGLALSAALTLATGLLLTTGLEFSCLFHDVPA